MDLKYFKTNNLGDCYVPENNFHNIIVIPKEGHPFIMACGKTPLKGIYQNIKISEKNFKKLKKAVQSPNRDATISLLKAVHKENKKILEDITSIGYPTYISDGRFNYTAMQEVDKYLEKDPILY